MREGKHTKSLYQRLPKKQHSAKMYELGCVVGAREVQRGVPRGEEIVPDGHVGLQSNRRG